PTSLIERVGEDPPNNRRLSSYWEEIDDTKKSSYYDPQAYENKEEEYVLLQKVEKNWETLKRSLDEGQLFQTYSMEEELLRLGIIAIHEDQQIVVIVPFRSLVQYLLHLAKAVLCLDQIQINSAYATEGSMVWENLQQLEQELAIINRTETIDEPLFWKKIEDRYQFHRCLQFVARQFLFEHILETKNTAVALDKAIQALHHKAAFPILPHYYEVANGPIHDPKEYLVICIWNTSDEDNKVKLHLPKISPRPVPESAIAFVTLTLYPSWKLVHESHPFTKSDAGVHRTAELNNAVFIRLMRIYSFFGAFSRPIIDRLFYGEVIKRELRKVSTSADINAFSHELSKIIDNIFHLSNVSFRELFEKDGNNRIAKAIVHQAHEEGMKKLTVREVKEWRLIPNEHRFQVWNNYLKMWSGRMMGSVFSIKDKATLFDLIRHCEGLAKDMYVGEQMKRSRQSKSFQLIDAYENNFNDKLKLLEKKSLKIVFRGKKIPNYILDTKTQSNGYTNLEHDRGITRSNAFLRIMVASLTNIYEHSDGKFLLHIRTKTDFKGSRALRFCFVNPFEKASRISRKESFGTEPVINSCLALLDGTLECFGRPKSKGQKQNWSEKSKIDPEKYDLWLTKFMIPIEGTFHSND
ncbi:MAG: hypothetical protein AAF985_25710, partial [Bacteroidota bacterium]